MAAHHLLFVTGMIKPPNILSVYCIRNIISGTVELASALRQAHRITITYAGYQVLYLLSALLYLPTH